MLISEDGIKLEIQDKESGRRFLKGIISPADFCSMMGRVACVPVELEVQDLDKVGRKQEMRTWEFEVPDVSYSERKSTAATLAQINCPKGWVPDVCFGSKDSFFKEGDVNWARTIIRRWL